MGVEVPKDPSPDQVDGADHDIQERRWQYRRSFAPPPIEEAGSELSDDDPVALNEETTSVLRALSGLDVLKPIEDAEMLKRMRGQSQDCTPAVLKGLIQESEETPIIRAVYTGTDGNVFCRFLSGKVYRIVND